MTNKLSTDQAESHMWEEVTLSIKYFPSTVSIAKISVFQSALIIFIPFKLSLFNVLLY